MAGVAGLTPNRTILELKPPKRPARWGGRIHSQSHHTGIETILNEDFLSPTTGSQSHHTGIETVSCQVRAVTKITPNRTILELKHSQTVRQSAVRSSQSHHTGIETCFFALI